MIHAPGAGPGLPQGALLVRDGSGHVQAWPPPPNDRNILSIINVPGPVLFIANDEPPHDGYNGFLDNSGEMQLSYQWGGDDVPDGQRDYRDPTPN